MSDRRRVFLSYKRNVEPDEPVALALHEAISADHDVFIDQEMLTGTDWTERIDQELERADFLISLLSQDSVKSQMVKGEIDKAVELHERRDGQGRKRGVPIILPVRVAYRDPFPYSLRAWLNPLNWSTWSSPADTPRLIEELRAAIAGHELPGTGEPAEESAEATGAAETAIPQPLPEADLERPGGSMDTHSAFYVARAADAVALKAIADQGVTLVIKAPRQMGKSSLLIRTMEAAAEGGKQVAFIDFQLFSKEALSDAEKFFREFCSLVTDDLELDDKTEEYWQLPLGDTQRCSRYFSRYLLKVLDAPLYLAMDEVDKVFDSPFRSDFFGMLRAWHNRRSRPQAPWRQLDLALVTSTEPYQLIEDLNQSPFNVGEILELDDFAPEAVADLNRRHGSPLSAAELGPLLDLVGGQPFLLRRALYLVAAGRSTLSELLERATDDRGPFGDHLRYHLFRIYKKPALVKALTEVIKHHRCPDEEVFWRLRGAGLVRREGGSELPRNGLYERYFSDRLDL